MGLFSKRSNEVKSDNFFDSVKRTLDTNALIYKDELEDFNTNTVVTVSPNEQVVFIKNGEIYGVLPSGRHTLKTDNYPVFSKIRNWLSGGETTFHCQLYHVVTSEQNVKWGTASPIELQDFFLGNGEIGVPTYVRGAGEFRVRFNINEDNNAAVKVFLKLMGDKSVYTVDDLSQLFRAQLSEEISTLVGQQLEEKSRKTSINAISSQLKMISTELTPIFEKLFSSYGFDLVNFSFYNLSIDDTEERKKYLDRRIAAANLQNDSYNQAVQQELLKDMANNPNGVSSLGAGIGMSLAAGTAFANMANSTMQTASPASSSKCSDPMELLTQLKKMLDAGLISQEKYDAKVDEIINLL